MGLIHATRMQISLMLNQLNFKLSFTIVMIYALLTYFIHLISYINIDVSVMLSSDALFIGNEDNPLFNLFIKVFPFIVVFPFAFSNILDREVNILPLLCTRMTKSHYYWSKLITSFIGGFLIILIPFLINLLLLKITFPNNNNSHFGPYNSLTYIQDLTGSNVYVSTVSTGLPFLKLYLYSPLLYNLFFTIMLALFAGILSMFALSFSLWIKKYKVILLIPIFLLFYLSDIADHLSYNLKYYINFRLLDYVTINTSFGKLPWFFIAFCLSLLIFSVLRIWIAIRLDMSKGRIPL